MKLRAPDVPIDERSTTNRGEAGARSRANVVSEALVGTALRRFKSLAETGEIPTLEGNPSARGRGDLV